jgi:ubiquinone/menaquinone biosynthesis C-methylase UbiE
MTMSSESSSNENTYILGHSGAEKARLIEQDRHFTRGMGGLLPDLADLPGIERVLDVACGPGGWALELAQAYPHMQVVGIDIDKGMIDYANAQARASGLENASFSVMNAIEPLDFANEAFDLVNARFMAGFLPTTAWSAVLQEFVRVVRSGGTIRLTESEWGGCTSAAYEQSLSFTIRAMQRAGQLFSPDDRHVGVTPMVRRLLSDTGCLNIREVAYALDFSTGTDIHMELYQDLWIAQKLLQPFHTAMGVATQQEVDEIYERIPVEMLSDDFYGILYLTTVLGEKP